MPGPDYVPVRRSERFAAKMGLRIGAAARNEELYATIVLRRRPDGAALPSADELSACDWSPRRRLSPSECGALYGASDDDVAAVSAFAVAHGLVVVEASAARRSVIVRSTAAQMSMAFRVDLGACEHNDDSSGPESSVRYRHRDGAAYVPAGLSAIVVGVHGLDNRPVAKSNAEVPPNTGPSSRDILPAVAASGKGVKAVAGLGGAFPSSIDRHRPS